MLVRMWRNWQARIYHWTTNASVHFSRSVVFDSLWPHEPQHARPPCPPKPMSFESMMPSNHLIHVIPFSSCPQSFPTSGPFPMSQLSASGGQSIGVSASTSVLPMNTQDWFTSRWTGWISLHSKGLSRARQQKRHRCIEQTFGLCGRGKGWDDLGEWHWNMYTNM